MTPAPPQRTPLQENMIIQEARNLRALREITPFSAAQSEDELPDIDFLQHGTGFDGIKPRSNIAPTPNSVLRTPMIEAGGGGSSTSSVSMLSRGGSSRATPLLRDQFGLNDRPPQRSMTPSAQTLLHEDRHDVDGSDAFSVSDMSTTSEVGAASLCVGFMRSVVMKCFDSFRCQSESAKN